MTTLNIPNLTRIHPLILLPGIGVASYVIVGFFVGSDPAAKASQHLAAASGRSSAPTGGGIPDRMPQTLWSAPATPVAPSAPVIATPMGGGGGASSSGGGNGASNSTSHGHENGNGHMPPPHAFVAPHHVDHAPPHMTPMAPPPQMAQRFAAAQPPAYHPAPAPFFGGLLRGFNGGGHLGGGGGHHR